MQNKRTWMRAVTVCIIGAVFNALAAQSASGASRFATARTPYTFSFPRDHFAHDAYRTEWWYFTGHLRAPDGRRFGYELTFFRFALRPQPPYVRLGQSRWHTAQLYPAHFAISDEREGEFVYAETLARDALGQGFASEHALDVRVNDWSLAGTNALRPRMRLRAQNAGNALDLSLVSAKPPAIHGKGGISRKAACESCASHYYSFTRLTTSGTLVRGGVRFRVEGMSWMDHEYGSDELQSDQRGWDWFSLQLNDGREVMLYRLRQRDGSTTPQSSGSLIERDGRVSDLPLSAFAIASQGTWHSPHTDTLYPSGWTVRVRGVANELRLVPVLADQELVNAQSSTYWEGAVDVRDAATGRFVGMGYVELTGYVAPVPL